MSKIKGVNVGGWFVTEKWITPSLYAFGKDETSLCVGLMLHGQNPTEYLAEHKRRFIQRFDFSAMRRVGINSVRIPFGYWVFDDYPSHPSFRGLRPFPKGELELLKEVVGWAVAEGLGVVLDLHCAPGCQNGFDNGGIQDVCEWHTRPEYIDYTIEVLGRIAHEFRSAPNLSIEVLNEPRWDIPSEIIKDFYIRSYDAIRKHMRHNEIIFHDGFRSFKEFSDLATLFGVSLDLHRYQCFGEDMIKMSFREHILHAIVNQHEEAEEVMRIWPRAYIGEWSLGLSSADVLPVPELVHALKREPGLDRDFALTTFAGAQALGFAPYTGTYFWTWKTEAGTPAWNYRHAVKQGWIK